MAGAEVTASSGDVIMVKEEEGESSGTHKTEVILHLQPILHGINDDIADTGTTVLAIETHHDDSQADGEEIEYGYPITCGDSRAVLLFKKFVCPGINVRCVKFNDQLISPKQFVHLAGKATLKDWKRAIRLGGVMLRKMMDSGQIDFYQHDTVCTNTCRSTKFDVLINSTRLPSSSSVPPTSSGLTADPLGGKLAPMPGEAVHDAAEVEEPSEEKFMASAEWSPGPANVNSTPANGHVAKRKRTSTPDGILSLWKGVADIGLMGEVLSSIQTELVATLKEVEVRSERADLQETDAMMLNSLCEMFGLLDSVKQALDLRRSQSEENRAHSALYVLDGNLEVQRKQGYDKSTSYRNMSSKRLRLHRRSPSASQTQSQHQASQSTLCPITGSPVIQPLTVAALSAASLAQLTVSPELFTRFSASVSTGHRHHAGIICGADRMDREGQHVEPEREHGVSLHSLGQEEDTSGSHTALRTAGAREEDSHLIGEQVEELERLYDINRVVVGRKASKKHKIQ
ncbi:glucocorticoid modulatory element-binding protein 1-like [Myripristis murdjan]|uniref:glucocorticoid modulatory element-binding protein 1-like n=1 Tax=Myripristis murdjan TaxID=586833 RepID=UPI001175F237|nr:glucocorticoid modulatory element-binding protein 1-like [Myripristis murdjan]XP_029929246.1 glucocorticoid modulatory element-binding protein 1-like [Myripristis murdjan]